MEAMRPVAWAMVGDVVVLYFVDRRVRSDEEAND